MNKKISLATLATMTALTLSACGGATADISDNFGPATNPNKIGRSDGPPADYNEQWWVSPDGCSYSRAQAPGYAPTWHLMLNAAHVGLTDAHTGCAMMFTQKQ